MQNKGVVSLDNLLFKPLTPSKEMVDPNTLLHCTNVLDAMIDSVYFSMNVTKRMRTKREKTNGYLRSLMRFWTEVAIVSL